MQFSRPEENIGHLRLKEGMTVADFGTGSGAYAFALAQAVGQSGKVYALDVQKDLLARLKEQAKSRGVRNLEVLWVDLDHPGGAKLAPHSVDAVVVANLLFQSEQKEGLLREAHYVLRPGGQLLILDWSESFGGMGPHKDHVVSEARAKELATKAGFVFEKAFFAGAHHYGLVYTK